MPRRKTQEEFIAQCKAKHGDRYDYSKVEYVNSSTKVIVICPNHGEFKILPGDHIRGVGCRKCFDDRLRKSQEEILECFRKAHGDRYDYSKVVYTGFDNRVTIVCPTHGDFEQKACAHIQGYGCLACANEKQTLTKEEFIEKAKVKHGEKYDYSKVLYINSLTKVIINCSEHGDFEQTPTNHYVHGNGCPKCSRDEVVSKRFEFQYRGITYKSIRHACRDLSKDYRLVTSRINAGWTVAQSFDDDPPPITHPFVVDGIVYNGVNDAVRKLNSPVNPATVRERIENGMNPLDALLTPSRTGKENGIVYVITNLINNKEYVGLTTTTIEERWQRHLDQTQNVKRSLIHKAILEFSPSNFTIRVIDRASSVEELKTKERYWIKTLNTFTPNGYNATRGGEIGGGYSKPTQIPGDPTVYPSIRAAAEVLAKKEGIKTRAAIYRIRSNYYAFTVEQFSPF